jgi:CheY-like chemotaxis protein
MADFKLMVVEDDDQDLQVCQDCINDFEKEQNCVLDLVLCKSPEKAFEQLDKSFDGAIIDLRLGDQSDAGMDVIRKIEEENIRIPIIILTGTPDPVDTSELPHISVLTKGNLGAGYNDLLNKLWAIHNTGLTRIMGGRGKIEETLSQVFRKNLMQKKYLDKWVEYGKIDPNRTERALLRHALAHLIQLLDDDDDKYFPEEVYLAPPLTANIQTGSIVKSKSDDTYYVVLNPVCDLVVRNGERNTDLILLGEIDTQATVFPKHPSTGRSSNQEGELKEAFKNKKSLYYHWLPKTVFFPGGFLNFRKITTVLHDDLKYRFIIPPALQISPSFVKDIIARFSAYYARQGQPEIDFQTILLPSTTETGK